MEIRSLDQADESRWDTYVLKNPHSSFFQHTGWKQVVETTYGHRPYYLLAEENQEITGILPLFLVNSWIFGRRLVSVPYGPYAGCSSDNRDIRNSLLERAKEIAREYRVKHIELRNTDNSLQLPTDTHHVTMLLDLTQGEDKVWFNLRKGMKACVKKASKAGLNYKLDSKDLAGFYAVYCRRMHELGTPVPPFSFFSAILQNFPDMKVATVDYRGEVLATQILLYFKKTVIYAWGASTNSLADYHPVHALLWQVIRKSIADGYTSFDFGRSALDSGTYDFKKWWGAEPVQLYYQYILNKGKEVPYIHPSNPRYGLVIKIWQKLPLPLANRIGPYGSRELV